MSTVNPVFYDGTNLQSKGGGVAQLANIYDVTLGGVVLGYTAITADYTATATNYTIHVTANSATVTLPASVSGRVYHIKSSTSGVVTVAANGAELIDGHATQTLARYDGMKIQGTGTGWIII